METKIKRNPRHEIVVDDVPIGYVLLDETGKVHWAELYDDFVHTQFEAKLLKQFAETINGYEWVEDE
jgi:c-di-AMP phosphodiesterase-like protein